MNTSLRRGGFRPAVAAIAVLGAAALVAACSSGSSSSSSSSSSSAATQPTSPAPAGSPIKLALMLDESSPNSVGQGDVAAKVAKAWASYTNSHGGVAGHKVTLDLIDTKGDPTVGQSTANDLVADPSTVGVLIADSSGESSFAKTLSDGKLPVVGGYGYYPTVWAALPNVFGITTTFPTVVNAQPLSAQKVGAKVVGAAVCAEVDSCASAAALFKGAAEKLGLTFTGTVKVSTTATDFTAECLQFVNSKTTFIQFSAASATGARLYRDCTQQGFTGYLGASGGTVSSSLYETPNLKMAGALFSFPWWTNDAPVKQYRTVMEVGGVASKDYGSSVSTGVYASLELFKQAMGAAQATLPATPTRADVIAAYGAVKDETLDGLLPQPMTFTANQPGPKVPCFWLYSYKSGKFSGTLTPTCEAAS